MDQYQAYDYFDMDPVIYTGPKMIYEDGKVAREWKEEFRDMGVWKDGYRHWERHIITPEGDLYLIDGGFQGEDGLRITQYIEEHGGKVKGWILTHPHVDHIGAFLDYMAVNSENVAGTTISGKTRVRRQ